MFTLLLKRRIIEKIVCNLCKRMKWIVCIKFVQKHGHVIENTKIIAEMNFIYQERNVIHFMPLTVLVFFVCIYQKRQSRLHKEDDLYIKDFLILGKHEGTAYFLCYIYLLEFLDCYFSDGTNYFEIFVTYIFMFFEYL